MLLSCIASLQGAEASGQPDLLSAPQLSDLCLLDRHLVVGFAAILLLLSSLLLRHVLYNRFHVSFSTIAQVQVRLLTPPLWIRVRLWCKETFLKNLSQQLNIPAEFMEIWEHSPNVFHVRLKGRLRGGAPGSDRPSRSRSPLSRAASSSSGSSPPSRVNVYWNNRSLAEHMGVGPAADTPFTVCDNFLPIKPRQISDDEQADDFSPESARLLQAQHFQDAQELRRVYAIEFERLNDDSAHPNLTHSKFTLTAHLKALNGDTAFTLYVGDAPTVQNFKLAFYLAGVEFRVAVCPSEPDGGLRYLTDAATLQEHNATYFVQVSKKEITCSHCGLPLTQGNI